LTYEVPLSYKTVTIKDDSQYTDYSKVKTDGVNGTQKCVDKVYYVNGVEQKRDVISRTVVVPSTDKVVITGTKKRPKYSGAGVSSGNLMWPVPSLHTITTYFTWRWGSFHTGIDISGGSAYGKTIVAADGGTVVSAGWSSGYGYCVKISHGGGLQTLYGHASKILVSAGQRVSKGQAIALVGSTGNSTGPHCHFEVIKNGTKVNPLSYVSR
jgi:Membrane proteins related to metalloendopeptidases